MGSLTMTLLFFGAAFDRGAIDLGDWLPGEIGFSLPLCVKPAQKVDQNAGAKNGKSQPEEQARRDDYK